MRETYAQLLGRIDGERVLDVATGRGGFLALLREHLPPREGRELVGIDVSSPPSPPETVFGQPGVTFARMDGSALDFPDQSFAVVSVANSLHHFAEPRRVLGEMWRVLRPGGHLIVGEMFRDGQTPAQRTHVELHHWWADIDTARGTLHRHTYERSQVLDLVGALPLSDPHVAEVADLDGDPQDEALRGELDTVIDTYLQRAEALPGAERFRERGESLRRRVRDVGFHNATQLVVVGRKA